MAETVQPKAPERAPREAPGELRPAPEVDFGRALRVGVVGGIVAVFVSAVGMVVAFNSPGLRIVESISAGSVLLHAVFLVTGYLAAKPPPQLEGFAPPVPGRRNPMAGLIAGIPASLMLIGFVALFDTVRLRSVFPNISPRLIETLTYDVGVGTGILLILAFGTALAVLGGALHLLPERWRGALFTAAGVTVVVGLLQLILNPTFEYLRIGVVRRLMYTGAGGLNWEAAAVLAAVVLALSAWRRSRPHAQRGSVRQRFLRMEESRRRRVGSLWLLVGIVALVFFPRMIGVGNSEVLDQAGIFLLMALGLNIVVGYAGLLDLGYVAFFAVGAYSAAVLTSPLSPAIAPELVFWAAIPFIMMAAAMAGIIVGTPVLRMRGDYLAIVTLGFGEIARILFLSDAMSETFGGAQGIIRIPDITVGPLTIHGPQAFFYLIFGFAVVFAYVSWALQDSRTGRAWMAMREDESVAEAMGVDVVGAKLRAFIIGAILASMGGALFAVKIGSVFPHSFDIVVSITILVIVIVGGLGSIPGVMVGALVLIGIPELLREFANYRFLLYGALLIFMMLQRPQGFIPSARRAAELREEELEQDAWLRKEQARQEQEEREAREAPAG